MRSRAVLPRALRLSSLLLAVALVTGACAQLADDQEPAAADMSRMLFWPDGNPHRGMQAFQDLKCTQCHMVQTVPELAQLTEGPAIGPALDSKTAKRERVDILVQIVAPGTDPSIQESHMGHFDEVMTVAQLTDLVAFVESLHE